MRKLLLLPVIIIPLLVFGILVLKNKSTTPGSSSAESNVAINESSSKSHSVDLDNFTISWFETGNLDHLLLIPNFKEKSSSTDINAKYNCSFLSSSAFYAANNLPLGLFISDGNTLANWQENTLLDGILSINDMATPRITKLTPQDHLQIAVQTGPFLKENNFFQSLRIQNDNGERRMIAAITGENKLFFLVIYNKNSEYEGPLLADVPSILKDFEQKTGIIFADAINLDGGTATAFKANSVNLSEFSPVGAFFCQP